MEKTGLYFVHISALTTACRRLWIGTGSGIIISIPLIDGESSTYIPLCNINNAQLSVHGYCDAVKFFVPVPGQSSDDNAKTIQAKQSDSSFVVVVMDIWIFVREIRHQSNQMMK